MPSQTFAAVRSSKLLCTGYTGETNLTNFQALVKLSPGNDYAFAYADCAEENGGDLWFTDSSGNVIPHEIDSWTVDGDSYVWVKIPEVVTNGAASFPTAITMHWGDSDEKAENACTTTETWSGFAGVWHMNGDVVNGEPQGEPDATGHGLTAVPTGVASATSTTLAAMGRTGGRVGNGRVNQKNGSSLQGLRVPDYSPYISTASKFTISGWWSATSLTDYPFFICARTSSSDKQWGLQGYNDRTANGYRNMKVYNATDSAWFLIDNFQSPEWAYVTAVFDGTTATVYSNGKKVYSYSNMVALTAITTGFLIGADTGGTIKHGWIGAYDEVRMHDGTVSADRVAADYATMNNPQWFLTSDSTIVTATWTGGAGDGDITKSANWNCYDSSGNLKAGKAPTESTDVTISGADVKMSVPPGTTLTAKSVTVSDCSLGSALDWRGLGELVCADGAVIDLNGNDLKVVGLGGAAMFTNSVDATTADLDVTIDSATENAATAIGGNIRFVKRGSATFTSSRTQTYTGGTLVVAGRLDQPSGSSGAYDATFTVFGTGTMTVGSGATYVTKNKAVYRNPIILAGGTLQNDLRNVTNIIRGVTADSTIKNNQNMFFGDGTGDLLCDMGGKTLTVTVANYLTFAQSFTEAPGKIVCSGSGYVQTSDSGVLVNATNVDFSIGCKLNPKDAEHLDVHDYAATCTDADAAGEPAATRWLKVHGTFTPAAAPFLGCEMQDGSSIDLSAKSAAWSVKSSRKSLNVVSFADGAAVRILLGSRIVTKDEAIVSWTEETRPANLASLKFIGVLDGRTVGLSKRSDGLYCARGLMITVR